MSRALTGEGSEAVEAGECLPELRDAWQHSWAVIWGPPGTGKTWTIGQQVATSMGGTGLGRTLVISTTNKATDGVAISIGRALSERGLSTDGVLRVGSGASLHRFEAEGLEALLPPTQESTRRELGLLQVAYDRADSGEDRAELFRRIQATRRQLRTGSPFADPETAVVACTLHYAAAQLANADNLSRILGGNPPFDTVIVDEAGLVCRAATAALSLLAATRFVLVGDPCQLAPISRMSRVIPLQEGRWISESGLSHLEASQSSPTNVHLLTQQRRMCPAVRKLISEYQYKGLLEDAPNAGPPEFLRESPLDEVSPATWYVLDEENVPMGQVRAERGSGNRSWIRRASVRVLEKIYKAHDQLQKADVLYLSPFTAQVRLVREHLAKSGNHFWKASSVHSQQGAEADVVIFDTVNASSTAWPYDEWKRLINVAFSRARHQVILLASRDEMDQPYLSSLKSNLAPRKLQGTGGVLRWLEVDVRSHHQPSEVVRNTGSGLGAQLEARSSMRPILSSEQQTLCERELDDRPRLVRGVAGSGKTVVLAHWAAQTLDRESKVGGKVWVLHGNQALRGLLQKLIQSAWESKFPGRELPLESLEILHVNEVLSSIMTEVGLPRGRAYEYESWAEDCLARIGEASLDPRCDVLFIDEAQDLGHDTLRLMTQLVRQRSEDPSSRSILVFYDNAQNVYGRSTPRWSDFGLDMRGRSTVMRESFRSTRPITEFALNVLYRLWDANLDPDLKELISQELVEPVRRNKRDWYNIHYNQLDGPAPEFDLFTKEGLELESVAQKIRKWIMEEGVRPRDIKVLCNQAKFRRRVVSKLEAVLSGTEVLVEEAASRGCSEQENVLSVSTAHSFKGYEAEIVVVPGAGRFAAKEPGVLHFPLYVAMTRARSLLLVTGSRGVAGEHNEKILNALQTSWEDQGQRLQVAPGLSVSQRLRDLIAAVGPEHEQWLRDLESVHVLHEEPITMDDGQVLAEPVFWIWKDGRVSACFGKSPPSSAVQERLEDVGVQVLQAGENVSSEAQLK